MMKFVLLLVITDMSQRRESNPGPHPYHLDKECKSLYLVIFKEF